jgi:hypothetical protein
MKALSLRERSVSLGWMIVTVVSFVVVTTEALDVVDRPWNRRHVVLDIVGRSIVMSTSSTSLLWPSLGIAIEQDEMDDTKEAIVERQFPYLGYPYESRDRQNNKDALIRDDYWYMMGKTPPRRMGEGMMKSDNPQWNTFGSCETTGSTNSCTYVSLKQRIPAYSKYAFLIRLGSKDFFKIRNEIEAEHWDAAKLLLLPSSSSVPPPAIDALLKMILLASSLLTSPNYSGPNRELLVARFYVNECAFATKELSLAIETKDRNRALAAWEFGRDSWNSYFTIVNRQINDKVGDKFELI